MKVITPKEFSFSETVSYLNRSANEIMFHVENDTVYKRIPADPEPILIEISEDSERSLHIDILDASAPQVHLLEKAAVDYVTEWFDLETDLAPFYQLGRIDPLLSLVTDRFYGLRCVGIPDMFEALCWGIIGQQINLTFAYTLKRRFVEAFGSSKEWNGHKYWSFPEPQRIASLKTGDLTALQMTSKKSEYLIGVAGLMAEGTLTKEGLLQLGDIRTAEKRLVAIRGIGPWTANYVLMRCLRYPSAFPIDDVGLHNAIKYLLGLSEKPTAAEIRQMSTNWSGWESYATFYLWRSLY
jgi:DNA-3-methyladenine glycosylase II